MNGTTHDNLVWWYQHPTLESAKIAGYACFYNERVDLYRLPAVRQGGRHLAVPYTRLAGQARGGAAAATLEPGGTPVLVMRRSGTASALGRRQVAASRDVGAAAAFSWRAGGRTLTFHAGDGRIRDQQTGSAWDQFGRAAAGPLAGSRLPPATAMDSPWFD